jgi:hypothetical protein
LEIIQVTLTIYAEDVEYNLLNMSEYKREMATNDEEKAYRIFSQIKGESNNNQRTA